MPDLPSLEQRDPDGAPNKEAKEAVGFASSWLSKGTYSPSDRTLSLTFQKGGEVVYSGVTPDVWLRMKGSASPGRFFRSEIQGRYPWE